ncbi:MAG: hypothetical protein A2138_02485 [Deltaproteobacteria bacterium RBG_16_71_12]|nr:MAG: hypothetical protein A2138_02485 [Deltaproteobacteria bacterium RBG_16_71_12]
MECETLTIIGTDLISLGGAEGIRRAGDIFIGQNDQLIDVAALGDITAVGGFTISGNGALETVAAGPLRVPLISIDHNSVRTIHLKVAGFRVVVGIDEENLESVGLDGTPAETDLTFVRSIPSDVRWNAQELGLVSLKVFEAPGADTPAELEVLGFPSELVGIYHSGLQPTSPDVDVYNARLREMGFEGTLEVCPHRCDARSTAYCDDPSRDPDDWRVGCVVHEGT